MAVVDVEIIEESQTRYLTYALSVVNSRALPDVRDGLKPVQRRILYAMSHNLSLNPDKAHRKSAAVVGEVLARYHPHGDSACYDAMVRMAQDFSLRYPLVDGQGNFGSLDGDSAAAYRYTEARLKALALEVVGEVGQETVAMRDNFDQTVMEPVVLPSRVPNLLINGASGIAVGMATAIPPHNLREVVKALVLLINDPKTTDTKILGAIKGPDFPTGCSILNDKNELKEIYKTGRGPIRMRADYRVEDGKRGKQFVVVTSVPYSVDKSSIVEKIADLIIGKKVPQLVDVRDESTDEIRVVLELAADADADIAMAYLFKHTPLQQNFNVNLTALIPTDNPMSGRPVQLSLREMLTQFIGFRLEVTTRKLEFEKRKLEARIHLLEGIEGVYDKIKEVIEIVRKSSGRKDSAERLQKKFKLSEAQSFFIVDLHIYQLSKTNIEEIRAELEDKKKRVREINKILKSDALLRAEVRTDVERIADTYGDDRRSKVVNEFEELELDTEAYVSHEDVHVVVTTDGWLKRIRSSNDPETTRIREGDTLFYTDECSTRDSLALFTNKGMAYVIRVYDLISTSGYGEPVQKNFRFQDGEVIVDCLTVHRDDQGEAEDGELMLVTERGLGFRLAEEELKDTKKTGKRFVKLRDDDALSAVSLVSGKFVALVSESGYVVCFDIGEVPQLNRGGKGVILQKIPSDDSLIGLASVDKGDRVEVLLDNDKTKEVAVKEMNIGVRAKRGLKLIKRGLPVVGVGVVGVEE